MQDPLQIGRSMDFSPWLLPPWRYFKRQSSVAIIITPLLPADTTGHDLNHTLTRPR